MEEETYLIKLGEKIAALRKTKGITQEQLAESCGFNRATVIRIEKGEVNSTINVLRKVAEQFGVELGELVTL